MDLTFIEDGNPDIKVGFRLLFFFFCPPRRSNIHSPWAEA